ncbi:MAG: transposase [Nitrospiraceae bacterium]|nr:transposase [Nitrospiraceae bacterium]
MTRKRHTKEQIIAVLKEVRAGVIAQDLCWKHGISDATLYNRRMKYADLEVSDVKIPSQLEEENRQLKQMVVKYAVDTQVQKTIPAPLPQVLVCVALPAA